MICAGARFLNILPSVLQKLEAAPVHHVVRHCTCCGEDEIADSI